MSGPIGGLAALAAKARALRPPQQDMAQAEEPAMQMPAMDLRQAGSFGEAEADAHRLMGAESPGPSYEAQVGEPLARGDPGAVAAVNEALALLAAQARAKAAPVQGFRPAVGRAGMVKAALE